MKRKPIFLFYRVLQALSIWFHAVSVGEVLAAIPLIAEVRKNAPRTPIFISTP